MEFDELWKAALGEIELQVSKANFKTWLQNTFITDKKAGTVTIAVPNSFTKEWLENKYHKFILKSLRNLDSEIKEVGYQISQNINKIVSKQISIGQRDNGLSVICKKGSIQLTAKPANIIKATLNPIV